MTAGAEEAARLTSQVVVEVLDGALAGGDGLDEESKHGEHSQAAILDLLDLQRNKPNLNSMQMPRATSCENFAACKSDHSRCTPQHAVSAADQTSPDT